MITIKTRKGKKFTADLVTESEDPARLRMNIIDSTLATIAVIFTDPSELPLEGHEEFTAFDSLAQTKVGVSVKLRKGSA